MKILFVYPNHPDTFWSFRYALRFTPKKATFPPLGLLTVAAMLPQEWEKKLIDMNTTRLTDKDISWADYVFVGGMVLHRHVIREIVDRCKKLNTRVVAGGPLFTVDYRDLGFDDVDHLVLNEAESTLQPFIEDLKKGCPKHVYTSEERPDISSTPSPLWSLVDMSKYTSMSVQYSRGCPFNCEFCDIILLNGRKPRTKTREQILGELDSLYDVGWRGGVFIVDDNFIGNRRKLKSEILPAVIQWMAAKKHPFSFTTEVSIDLADDNELMQLMAEAGFNTVFVGIESPNEESLTECNKMQNKNRDLVDSVKKIQHYGMQVMGGFIVGFDSDPASIFRSQINFIQKSGIVTAMVGLLIAPPGTKLYQRLKKENRILPGGSGDNTDCSMNFIPKMDYQALINGYRHILATIYSPKQYCERIKVFLREYKPQSKSKGKLSPYHIRALVKSMWVLGVREKGRRYYWNLLLSTLLRHPRSFSLAVTFAIQGFHFRKIFEKFRDTPVSEMVSFRQMKSLGDDKVSGC